MFFGFFLLCEFFFFFNDTATTEIYTLSLHDALPISEPRLTISESPDDGMGRTLRDPRSEEHTSELQSHNDIVCRLLLEKKNRDRNLPSQSATTDTKPASHHAPRPA